MTTTKVNGVPYRMRADMPKAYKRDLPKVDPFKPSSWNLCVPLTDGLIVQDEANWYAGKLKELRRAS